MNGRMIVMLIIALIFAAIAAFIAKVWLGKQVREQKVVSTQVVAAATEIPFGIRLEETHLKLIDWSGSDVPRGSFSKTADAIGKITKNNFYPGEVITQQRVAEHLGGSTLSSLISENYRAISIRVNDVVGVAGFILPGNRIDILSVKKAGSNAKAQTILENIKVLAVDQEASTNKEKPAVVRAVTLELTPDDAERIAEAVQEGKIQLTLRNPLDSNIAVKQEGQPKPVIKPKPIRRRSRGPSVVVVPW